MDSQSKLILFNCNEDYELKLYTEDNLKNIDTDDIIQIREFSELRLLLNSNDSDYFEMPEMDDYFIPNRILTGNNDHYKYQANDYFVLFSLRKTCQMPGRHEILDRRRKHHQLSNVPVTKSFF